MCPFALQGSERARAHVHLYGALSPFHLDAAAVVSTASPEGELAVAVVELVLLVAFFVDIEGFDVSAQIVALGEEPFVRITRRHFALLHHDGVGVATFLTTHLSGSSEHLVGASLLVVEGVAFGGVTRAIPKVSVGVGRLVRLQGDMVSSTVVADVKTG